MKEKDMQKEFENNEHSNDITTNLLKDDINEIKNNDEEQTEINKDIQSQEDKQKNNIQDDPKEKNIDEEFDEINTKAGDIKKKIEEISKYLQIESQ